MASARPRAVLACALLAATALAGCASAPVGDAEAAHAGTDCEVGRVVVGFLADGAPRCAPVPAPALASFACPKGRFVAGFDADGKPLCATPIATTAPATPVKEATQEVSSNLKVTGIYGVRNTTALDIWDLKINVELSAGAVPMDLTKLVIRYSDGSTTRNYAHAPSALADAAAPSSAFHTTWIRGDGSQHVMESGDLVQLHFNLVDDTLPTRTPVQIALIPEAGSPVAADFKTPATYSTYTIVTLR